MHGGAGTLSQRFNCPRPSLHVIPAVTRRDRDDGMEMFDYGELSGEDDDDEYDDDDEDDPYGAGGGLAANADVVRMMNHAVAQMRQQMALTACPGCAPYGPKPRPRCALAAR